MPKRAKTACAHRGCAELVERGYCAAHMQSAASKISDRWRGSSSSRGYDAAWQRVRLQALRRDYYLCQLCAAADRIASATEVDHIVPLSAGGSRLNLANLQAICHPCHVAKTRKDIAEGMGMSFVFSSIA